MNEETQLLIQQYNTIEPQFPSYVDTNHYGICLRAARDLKKGTVVATANLEQTDKEYIAGHASPEYKYVALMRIMPDGKHIYGRVRGKWAFCNHSCDPNCCLNENWEVVTNRDVMQGQELTTAYDMYVPDFPWQDTWNFACLCDAVNCKKLIKEYRMDIVSPNLRR